MSTPPEWGKSACPLSLPPCKDEETEVPRGQRICPAYSVCYTVGLCGPTGLFSHQHSDHVQVHGVCVCLNMCGFMCTCTFVHMCVEALA